MKYLVTGFAVFLLFWFSITSLSAQTKNSVQGDFEALQALYNATQGQGVPTLNSVNELPSDPRDAEYPYMYMIDGEVHYLEYARYQEFIDGGSDGWRNAGKPWYNDAGWVNMTPETMGEAVGITTDENGRVTRVDFQKITTELVNGVYLTRGNGLVGKLPEEIGNLSKLQYWNVKQNLLFGRIPSSIQNWREVKRISFAGENWDMEIDEENRRQWHESDHRKGYEAIEIVDGLAVGTGRLSGIGKKIMASNRFRTDVPNVDGQINLELFEMRHQFLIGTLPEWSNLPSIRAILLDNSREAGAESISGAVPESWGNLKTTVVFQIANYHTNPKFSGSLPLSLNNWVNLANFDVSDHNFTGPILEFPLSRDKRYIRFNNNNFTGGFPSAYFNGDNSQLTKWQISNNNLTGELPQTITPPVYPKERSNYAVDAPGIGGNNFTGPLPEWYQTMLGIQTFFISDENFSGPFPEKVMDQNNLKTFFIRNNNFSGYLPDKSWGDNRISQFHINGNNFSGPIPERWRSLILTNSHEYQWSSKITDIEKNALSVFNGTSITLNWKPVDGAMAYVVSLLDTEARKVYENKYVTSTEISISGLPYGEYRPIITAVNWSNAKSFTGTSATLTWDPLKGAAGYQVEIYDSGNKLVLRESWMNNETLNVSGLDSDTYTWRVRGMKYVSNMGAANFYNNNLSGPIPEFFSEIEIGSFRLDGNRYTFRDIGPVYRTFLSANFTNFEIGNQKPFGQIQSRTMPVGETVVFDLSEFDYPGNTYQWIKDGTPIEGENSSVLSIPNLSTEDEGNYVLEVQNRDLPELGTHQSQPINFRIGADDSGNASGGSVDSKNDDDDGGGSSDGGTDKGLGGGTQPFPSAPVLNGPEDERENVSLTPEFTWSDIGADYYILHVSRRDPGERVVEVIVEDTGYVPGEILDAGAIHDWRVRGVKEGEKGEWSDVRRFTTGEKNLPDVAGEHFPSAPVLNGPEDERENVSLTPEFTWSDIGADYYILHVSRRDPGERVVEVIVEDTGYVPGEILDAGAIHDWRVRGVKEGEKGEWSDVRRFTTGEKNLPDVAGEHFPSAPVLNGPEDERENVSLTPEFTWSDIGADYYILHVSRRDPGERVVEVIVEDTGYVPGEILDAGAIHDWRVRGVKEGEKGEWSDVRRFTTGEKNLPDVAGEHFPSAPVLNGPEDERENVSLTPEFTWSDIGADYYILHVSRRDPGERVVEVIVEDTGYVPGEILDAGAIHDWRVRGVKEGEKGEWSDVRRFTTGEKNLPDVAGEHFPSAPVLNGPEDERENVSLTPEFTWSDIGADYYILHVSRRDPGERVVEVIVEDTGYVPGEILDAGAIHDWRVRGVKEGEKGEWSDVRRFTTGEKNLPDVAGEHFPSAPVLNGPEDERENVSLTPEFTWSDIGADYYILHVSRRDPGERVVEVIVEDTGYVPGEILDAGAIHDWRVRGVKEGEKGEWSDVRRFTTGEKNLPDVAGEHFPSAPVLNGPEDERENVSLTPEFTWSDIGADYYILHVSRRDPGERVVEVIVEDTGYVPGEILDAGAIHDWRVRGVKEGEKGEWSDLWTFTLSKPMMAQKAAGSTQSNEQQPVITSLEQNYPNPFNPTTRIEFALSEAQKVSLKVYDMAGRQVATLIDNVLQAGHHSARFDASKLASGIYIYRFISDTHQFSRKMTLIK